MWDMSRNEKYERCRQLNINKIADWGPKNEETTRVKKWDFMLIMQLTVCDLIPIHENAMDKWHETHQLRQIASIVRM